MDITYDNGTSALTTAVVNSIYGMIETLAQETVLNAEPLHTLKEFDKGMIEYGTIIENAIVKMATSTTFSSSANPFTKVNPALVVKIFKTWNKYQFTATVETDEIRKIIQSGSQSETAQKIASDIVASLTMGEDFEDFKNLKENLKNGKTGMTACFTATAESTNTQVLQAIRNTVDSFRFTNSAFCPAGIESATPTSRIRIVMPYKLKNKIDVETLAHMMNLEKAEILAKIDDIDTDDGIIYIIDKMAVVDFCRLKEITSQTNGAGRYTNYFYTVDKIYGMSPLFKQTFLDCSKLV